MGKIIPSILLTASASCNLLFAQVAIREQVRDTSQVTEYRVQGKNRLKATNQVRGCRLQVTGTNQTTNYRLQVEDNNKIELSSEGQIRQQANLLRTANYEPRTVT